MAEPQNWQECVEPSTGRSYFYDTVSCSSQWERPLSLSAAFGEPPVLEGASPAATMARRFSLLPHQRRLSQSRVVSEEDEEEREPTAKANAEPRRWSVAHAVALAVPDTSARVAALQRLAVQAESDAQTAARSTAAMHDLGAGGPLQRSGYLVKRATSGKENWKKRWFVLQGPQLSWSEKAGEKKVKGTFVLDATSTARAADVDPDRTPALHEFELATGEARLVLRAERYLDMRAWLTDIQSVVAAEEQHASGRDPGTSAAALFTASAAEASALDAAVSQLHDLAADDAEAGCLEMREPLERLAALRANLLELERGVEVAASAASRVSAWGTTDELEGWLVKRAMSGKDSWKRRYFVLSPHQRSLSYWESDKDKDKPARRKGTLQLTSASRVGPVSQKEHAFELKASGGDLVVQVGRGSVTCLRGRCTVPP
jgi:hypothetical protein